MEKWQTKPSFPWSWDLKGPLWWVDLKFLVRSKIGETQTKLIPYDDLDSCLSTTLTISNPLISAEIMKGHFGDVLRKTVGLLTV